MANITIKDFKFPRNGNTYFIPQVDDTLSISGAAADAKKTGDEIELLKEDLGDLKQTLTYIPENLEIGVNRYVSETSLIRATNANRASTVPAAIYSDFLAVFPRSPYTIHVFAESDGAWSVLKAGITTPTQVQLNGYDKYCIQVVSSAEILADAEPFRIVFNTNVESVIDDVNGIIEKNELVFTTISAYIDSGQKKVSASSGSRCVWAEVSGATTYTISKTVGQRFSIGFTTAVPAGNVSILQEGLTVENTAGSISARAPKSAKYIVAYVYNGSVDEGTAEAMIASVRIEEKAAVDATARSSLAELQSDYVGMFVDANNSDYWAIMGLGSNGENYTPRNWNISSDAYLSNIISVTTDDGYATRYVLYNSNKEFIYRSGFFREEISILSLMEEYSATYVRFEVQALDESGVEIQTPIDNVSRYAHVHLYVLRDSGIKIAGASEKWYEDSIVQSTYLDRIKQAKYVYASTDSGVSPHPVLTLLHFSDVHGNADAMRYALAINDIFANDIDDMLHTGDVVTANLSDGISNWISSGCANKVLNVIGNHDTEANLVLQAAGKDNVYNTIFAPYIAQWGVTQPTGVDTSGSDNYHALYYYKDYSAAEVRLIVLDTNFWDEAQKTWLTNVLADAKTNGLCVVIACHNVKLLTEMTNSNFSSYNGDGITETGNSYANQPSDWLDPVDDFINGGGNFACILAGHNHDGHMGTMTNYPNIFVYVSDKASVARVSGAARITGEMNANAVSIVVINPVEKLFKIVKIGAQIDGKMRPQNVFCYDYANKQIISQW